jgi:hypothetical protein
MLAGDRGAAVTYVRRYDRENSITDLVQVVFLVLVVVVIMLFAIADQITHPHGLARPACEAQGGSWTKTGERYSTTKKRWVDRMECRYRITGKIGEAP